MPDLALSNGAIGGVEACRYALFGVGHFHLMAMIRDCRFCAGLMARSLVTGDDPKTGYDGSARQG